MTFYSAGFYVEPTEEYDDDVPGLSEMREVIQYLPISPKIKSWILENATPSMKRHYKKVQKETFTDELRDKLIQAYADALHVDRKKFTFTPVAVTDREKGITYLLPEFFDLRKTENGTPAQQMALLWHENYWLLMGNVTYEEVINSEEAFQAMIENPNVPKYIYAWLRSIKLGVDVLETALHFDMKSGAMNDLISQDPKLCPSKICLSTKILGATEEYKNTQDSMLALYALMKTHKESQFLRRFYDILTLNVICRDSLQAAVVHGYPFDLNFELIFVDPVGNTQLYVHQLQGKDFVAFNY